jgi:hypothetical protein
MMDAIKPDAAPAASGLRRALMGRRKSDVDKTKCQARQVQSDPVVVYFGRDIAALLLVADGMVEAALYPHVRRVGWFGSIDEALRAIKAALIPAVNST